MFLSGCGPTCLAGRAVPRMEEAVVAAPSQCSRGRKRKAWEACESVARETTKSLRQCGRFVHHPLSSSSDRGKASYIATWKDGTGASGGPWSCRYVGYNWCLLFHNCLIDAAEDNHFDPEESLQGINSRFNSSLDGLVGRIYDLIGGSRPGAKSLHVCGGKKWWCVCRWTGISMPRSRCETSPPARQKIGKIRRERVLLATSLRQKFFAKELNFHKKAGKKNEAEV